MPSDEQNVVAVTTPLTATFFEPIRNELQALGYQVRSYDSLTAFLNDSSALTDVDVLYAVGALPIGREIFARAPRLRGLVSPFTGIEGFDVAAATERGVIVANGQTRENVESVAEATVLMMLEALYDLAAARAELRKGWRVGEPLHSRMLKGRTVGLIGFGQIAQAVAERLATWQVNIIVSAPRLPVALPPKVRRVELNELLSASDLVSVHAPLNEETRGLIGRDQLLLLKPDAVLVVTSRGGIVDEEALCRLAEERPAFRFALDVFAKEPLPLDSPLRRVPSAILTPHCLAHTQESLASLVSTAIENIRRIFAGEPPVYICNPQLIPAWTARWSSEDRKRQRDRQASHP
jgi:D-3-phosphoglycerate dehydrogenase